MNKCCLYWQAKAYIWRGNQKEVKINYCPECGSWICDHPDCDGEYHKIDDDRGERCQDE